MTTLSNHTARSDPHTPHVPPDPVLAERERISTIYAMAEALTQPRSIADEHVRSGASIATATAAIRAAHERHHNAHDQGTPRFTQISDRTLDNPAFGAAAVSDAIYARLSGKTAQGPASRYANASLLDLGSTLLDVRGQTGSRFLSKSNLADKVMASAGRHSTSDFPNLLLGAGNRVLQESFEAAASVLKPLAAIRDAQDFRPMTAVRVGEAPTYDLIVEGGEVKFGTIGEDAVAFALKTYAKGFALTREAIINDDLGAFSDFLRIMARGAAATEANLLAAIINGNPTMQDGIALFHANHGNLSGSPAALSVASLSGARAAMRAQVGIDGSVIGITPMTIVVPTALETVAEQIVAPFAAAQTRSIRLLASSMSLLSLGCRARQLGTYSPPQTTPALTIAYLQGKRAPEMSTREGWTTLGQEFRAVHDFACAATEWRAAFKNAGA